MYISRFFCSEQGNASTEYAVMLSLIIIVSIGAITALGSKITAIFEAVSNIG